MKIIFLDIDGVLLHAEFWERIAPPVRDGLKHQYHEEDGHHRLDPEAVELMNRLVTESGASVVLSSTWRKLFDAPADFNKAIALRGCNFEVIDFTINGNGHRGTEIDEWLSRHEVEQYIIIDNDSDFHDHQLPFHVHTSWRRGLENKHLEQALNLLKESLKFLPLFPIDR